MLRPMLPHASTPSLMSHHYSRAALVHQLSASNEDSGGLLPLAYQAAGIASAATWAAIAVGALATYKPHRITHNSIGVMQALTALPIIISCCAALADFAKGGWSELQSEDARRLNLGLAAASMWSAVTVVWAPAFTAANVRTIDPVVYAMPLLASATTVHLAVAGLCLAVWRRSVPRASVTRVVNGVLSSLWRLGPQAPEIDSAAAAPQPSPSALSTLALSFASFTCISALSPFPLATVPSLLGKRLARASGAWTLLTVAILITLKDGAERVLRDAAGAFASVTEPAPPRQSSSAAAHAILGRGVQIHAASHLAVAAARPLLDTTALYPAAFACRPAVLLSIVVYVLALRRAHV